MAGQVIYFAYSDMALNTWRRFVMRPTEPSKSPAASCSTRAACRLLRARRNAAMRSRASARLIAANEIVLTR